MCRPRNLHRLLMHCNAERRPPAGSPDIPLVLATSRQVGQHHGAMVICAATIISNACIPSHPSFQSHRSGYCGNMKDDCMFAPSYIAADLSQSLPIKTISHQLSVLLVHTLFCHLAPTYLQSTFIKFCKTL